MLWAAPSEGENASNSNAFELNNFPLFLDHSTPKLSTLLTFLCKKLHKTLKEYVFHDVLLSSALRVLEKLYPPCIV